VSASTSRQPIRWNARGRAVGFALSCLLGAAGFLLFVAMFAILGGPQ
jgi:hypothetical protein